MRNIAEVYKANPIFPWTDPEVAWYVGKLPEKVVFDRINFKNKLPLRRLLKEKLDLDSDKLGKFSYGFDAYKFLCSIEKKFKEEILECPLWNKRKTEKIYQNFRKKDSKKLFRKLLIRLFILSSWYNHCKYLKG